MCSSLLEMRKSVFLQAITRFFISSTFQAELPNAMQLLRHQTVQALYDLKML